jgi:gliding motility-associated-like protein
MRRPDGTLIFFIFHPLMLSVHKGLLIPLFCLSCLYKGLAQFTYSFTFKAEDCTKGYAILSVSGATENYTIQSEWSNGRTTPAQITNGNIFTSQITVLDSGDYSVLSTMWYKDSITHRRDTTLYFRIHGVRCGISVDKYFSPNDDGYHDRLQISNIIYYPDFELHIFDKWGQRVHHQSGIYTPWDGKWNGLDMPIGAYYYVFLYRSGDKKAVERGDITLLR